MAKELEPVSAQGEDSMCKVSGFLRRWLNAIGLSLGIVGVVFIFVWGPPQPSFERHEPVYSSSRAHEAPAEAEEQRYKCMSRFGLGLILAGFVLQFANEFLPRDD
jgi:hypothetical protein